MNYLGDYDGYLYAVTKEIEDGERETATQMAKTPADVVKIKDASKSVLRSERDVRKEMNNIEKTIAKLDEQKKFANERLMSATDPADALRVHNELVDFANQLNQAEERWCALLEELSQFD